MSISTQRTDPTTTTAPVGSTSVHDAPRVVEDHRRRTVAFVGTLAVVTAAAIGTWAYVGSRPAEAPAPAAATTTWTSGYGPGSTTYAEQVPTVTTPDHAGWHGSRTEWPSEVVPPQGDRYWQDAYGPGSTTRTEQVPPDGDRYWQDAYGPGSTTRAEQVPQADRPWQDSYGPGSSTYAEQVPQG